MKVSIEFRGLCGISGFRHDRGGDLSLRERSIMRRERIAQLAILVFFGVVSSVILPDGWKLVSIPIALAAVSLALGYLRTRDARRDSGAESLDGRDK